MSAHCHFLYLYPWMPYPRRLIVFLRERHIPSSVVKIVPVTDPGAGDAVIDLLANTVPPRPAGSLPILAIPPPKFSTSESNTGVRTLEGWRTLGQSGAIMHYLDTLQQLDQRINSESASNQKPMPYETACIASYEHTAEAALASWNPVRLFGTKAGPVKEYIPEAAREGLQWTHRELAALETHLDPVTARDIQGGGYRARLGDGGVPAIGDIMVLSFLEMVDDLYGRFEELTGGGKTGGGNSKDAYGREVERKGWYPHVRELYALWRQRPAARRREGEEVPQAVRANGVAWVDGVWE